MYVRIRRMVSRQKVSRARIAMHLLSWPILFVFPLLFVHPAHGLPLLCGAVVGFGLGMYALRLTEFEESPSGLFYTPNAQMGIAVALLLVCRIAYRFAQVLLSRVPIGAPSGDFMRSPLTLAILGTLAGHYMVYNIGLWRWYRRVTASGSISTIAAPPGA